jgi:hypothetical protein
MAAGCELRAAIAGTAHEPQKKKRGTVPFTMDGWAVLEPGGNQETSWHPSQ